MEEIKEQDVDSILISIGEFGRCQKLLLVVISFLMIPTASQVLIMTFLEINPSWRCSGNGSFECNRTGEFSISHEFYHNRCKMKRNSWSFVKEKGFSIITEWDLVCGKASLAYIIFSIMQVGDALGGVLVGMLSDKYGRKKVLYVSWFGFIVIATISSLVHNFWVFLHLQFLVGILHGGSFNVQWVLMSEMLGPNSRSYLNILWCVYSFALSFMSLQSWLIPKWRAFELTMTTPYLILLVTYKFVPESVRWLHANNKRDLAEKVLRNIAKCNKKMFPKVKLCNANNISSAVDLTKTSIKYVFFPFKMFLITFSQMSIYFSASLAFYGISLFAENLSGNLHRDFAIVSLVDIPSNLISIWLCNRFGKKRTTMVSAVAGGFNIVILAFVPFTASLSWIRVLIGTSGKFFANISFNVIYIWSTEIYPTGVRSQGLGVCISAAVIGTSVSPWITQYLVQFHQTLPFVIIGSLLILSGNLSCFLPEVNKENLSDTNEENQSEKQSLL
ncbi:solute carrier family 22 member 15-like isoform X1 [Hydra vulgaris]|uniref:solute carrier family 22 member 15-like isoform X1 n=2 Tax=Hydra vulgaris TaxID=6087 RepID=UPI001F5FF1AF|nr:solute carrier family 22 member 15-like isoform X1 [Hydra vulgaris]XP_047145038.1 solute carrier family 22 member 15-like isoform X1 [Hydra vulgaris]XP_047145039.1 solute carrier family 22 member 15-like isoform X1 [Hydra vulgaris]XP_047145040.1 solute carrier family 22 member 15-like isoform X1 [Hydra vulgaris]